ncbi:unnamed protein product [Haemonchus placei]|uniref:Col_cuticle_N domain-containing protein n=1 Tax=Haemonchus placei TaxID=6290 RepID=A0A0N4VYA3_HAEPC|nr:unnamed protein product [Haemonchus placei]
MSLGMLENSLNQENKPVVVVVVVVAVVVAAAAVVVIVVGAVVVVDESLLPCVLSYRFSQNDVLTPVDWTHHGQSRKVLTESCTGYIHT